MGTHARTPAAPLLTGRRRLQADLVAGLTVAVMLVPQSMAYAELAGMPPVTGLYAALAALVAYGLIGSSPHLAVGPVALISLLTATGLGGLAGSDPARYVTLAASLAALVGLIQIGLGLLRAGFLVNFLSRPVISGFTSAAALIIGASQLRTLLGLHLPRPDSFAHAIGGALGSLAEVHWITAAVGLATVVALALIRRLRPGLPGPLVVVAAATAVGALLGLDSRGLVTVGTVPGGLPVPSFPHLGGILELVPMAATIALIGYLEGVSVAKSLAARAGTHVEPNRELAAIGVSNTAAALAGGFPVAGGFSRSAVQYQAGAVTRFTGVVAAGGIVLTLLVLTPLLRGVPTTVLAAIIIVAVSGLIDLEEPRHAWKVGKRDAAAWGLTFGVTLGFGVETGIGAGVAFALAMFVYQSAQPHIVELGRVEGRTGLYRNINRFMTVGDPSVAVFRVDGPLFYANAKFVIDWLTEAIEAQPALRWVLLDASAIADIDASAERGVAQLIETLALRGVGLHLATVRGPVRDRLQRSGLWEQLGPARIHEDVEKGLIHLLESGSAMLSPIEEETAPSIVY